MCLLATTIFMASAQPSWQWGKRGGSSDVDGGGNGETVVDMATDQHGNVYVLSTMMQTGANVDGHAIAEWGGVDVVISSFKCDGTYRWSKTIGGTQDDHGMALRADTLGGVYVTGFLGTHFVTIHLDVDSTFGTLTTYKSFYLLKYDTAGTYEWFRMPQPDTAGMSAYSYTVATDMDVDGAGNIYMLCSLYPGAYAGGAYIVPSLGYYMLVYDKNGNFLRGNPMQITNSGVSPLFKMKKDFQNGRCYLTGVHPFADTFSFGSTQITSSQFVGCFDNSGILLWIRQGTDAAGFFSAFGRPAIDAQHNIYLAGRASVFDTFNTYAMSSGGSTADPVVFKLDTNGNNIWGANATVNGVTSCNSVVLNGSEVAISGEYPGKLKWAGFPDSLDLPSGSGYHIFITTFDATTGNVLKLDSLASTTGDNNLATAMASDNLGNFYVGGNFSADLLVNGTTLSCVGGVSDFFVAKYGTSNCNLAMLETSSLPLPTTKTLVYPNPVTDELTIENASAGTTIRLLSIIGLQIYEGVIGNDKQVINTGYLAAGTYLLQLTDNNGNRTTKTIVKQ